MKFVNIKGGGELGEQGSKTPLLEVMACNYTLPLTPTHHISALQVLIAESYGGADEPVDTLVNNFVGAGVEPVMDPLRVKADPNEATYQVPQCLPALSCIQFASVCTLKPAGLPESACTHSQERSELVNTDIWAARLWQHQCAPALSGTEPAAGL